MATKRKQTRGASGGGQRASGGKRKRGARAASGRSTAARGRASGRAAGGRAGGAGASDALSLLKRDHREVERLLEEFERARAPRKAELAEEICRQLSVHAMIEEQVFYPAVRNALREEDLVDEAEVEHQSAKDLIAQIQGSSPGDDKFEARVQVLGEYVKHHVREEEREMFPQLTGSRKIDLEQIGGQLMQRKQELLGQASDGESMLDEESTTRPRGRSNGARAPRGESATMSAAGNGSTG